MNVLAIDTTGARMAVCAEIDGRVYCRSGNSDKRHNGALLAEIEALLAEAGADPARLDAVGAVVGPGSFTGIRIGVSAAKGLARGLGIPAAGVTAFDLLAYDEDRPLIAAVDCGHGNCYAAFYGETGGAERTGEYAREALERTGLRILEPAAPKPEALCALVRAAAERGGDTLAPLYMKKSQAEREREGR